ncbi:DDE-type integrase/transposase/recombinase [Rhodococcus jostii]|uniref:DDE-type integrase/transposase/recombinase n=1 Tax=Rhodococcus jostii TaxID=132919 RepID=UPI00363DE2BD
MRGTTGARCRVSTASPPPQVRVGNGAGWRPIRRRSNPNSSPTSRRWCGPGTSPSSAAPAKGVWYHLYVLIDIYSKYNPAWIVAPGESADLAKDFIDEAIARNVAVPHTVHADRGTSMTSGPESRC